MLWENPDLQHRLAAHETLLCTHSSESVREQGVYGTERRAWTGVTLGPVSNTVLHRDVRIWVNHLTSPVSLLVKWDGYLHMLQVSLHMLQVLQKLTKGNLTKMGLGSHKGEFSYSTTACQ